MIVLARFYHSKTGEIHQYIVQASSDELLQLNTPPGHIAFEARGLDVDHTKHRFDLATNKVVEK